MCVFPPPSPPSSVVGGPCRVSASHPLQVEASVQKSQVVASWLGRGISPVLLASPLPGAAFTLRPTPYHVGNNFNVGNQFKHFQQFCLTAKTLTVEYVP